MRARRNTSIMLGLVAVLVFALRWPLDDYISDARTWPSRPPAAEGRQFFSTVFRGGGGTPAIFAMLGGQRYVVANIIWNYADLLFHRGKPFEMVYPLDAVVTLHPAFTDAWSVYGWHLAWNLYSYVDDLPSKVYWLEQGEKVYQRALATNPDNPRPYFDLAWLYINRTGQFEKAVAPLEEVVNSGRFKPVTGNDFKRLATDFDTITGRKWLPQVYGNRLAYVYMKLGIQTGEQDYFDKAIKTYLRAYELDPSNTAGMKNADTLRKNRYNAEWLAEKREEDRKSRDAFGLPKIQYGRSPTSEFSPGTSHDHGHE